MTAHRQLHRARILDLFTESEVEGLSLLGEEHSFDTGQLLFREGDGAEGLYILLHGQVKLSCIERGQELELQRHHPGDHFASVALVDGQLCHTRAVGLSFGKVFVLSTEGCAALLSRISRGRPLIRKLTPAPVIQHVEAAAEQSDTERPPPSSAGDSLHIRSLSSAVAGVAHEINTPLGVIENAASFVGEQLSAENLAQLALEPAAAEVLGDVAEACRLIQKNVAHAARLVQSFKKLSVGQLAEPRVQADLVRVIQEVLNVFRAKTISALPPGANYNGLSGKSGQHRLILASSRLDVRVSCALAEPERIWDGFPGLFSRVLLNLLTNIDRYAYPGAEPGKVDITLEMVRPPRGEARFELKVRDYGAGIAEADLPHIFDPFFTTGRDKGGTGLGLAMVHNLVTQGFNGTVRASSLAGEGTTFEISLPLRAPDHGSVLNQSLEPHHRLLEPGGARSVPANRVR
jgi:signal transduction histidine kinase